MKKNKGGPIHGQYIDYLFEYFNHDCTYVVREGRLNHKSVDLLVHDFKADQLIGIEVQLTSRHARKNIQADLDNGCEQVVIASPSLKTLGTIETSVLSSFPQHIANKVAYMHIVPGEKMHITFSVITRNKVRIKPFKAE